MTKNCLKLFEYESKSINGTGDFVLSCSEVDKFEHLNDKLRTELKTGSDIISFRYKIGVAYEIAALSSYVGLMRISSKTIQIIPKLAKNNQNGDKEYSALSIKNLLYMLSYTKKLEIKETDLSGLSQSKDDFFEVLIYLLAKNLLAIVRSNMNRQYVTQEENLSFIRGKLNMGVHIRKNISHRNRFYLEFDEFCEDNLINQIFKYTVNLLVRTTGDINNRKLLQELCFIFADVSPKKIAANDFKSLNLNRLTSAYAPVLNLCKLFVSNGSLELNYGSIESYSFIFDMNLLFEEFVGEFIKRNFYDNFGLITTQKPIRWLVDKKISGGIIQDNLFRLIPDIQLYKNSIDADPRIIIDTKYKMLVSENDRKEGVAQGDLYQMNAYSKKFNCKSVVLLYPKPFDRDKKEAEFIIDDGTSVFIRTIDLCRDLKISTKCLREELAQILTGIN